MQNSTRAAWWSVLGVGACGVVAAGCGASGGGGGARGTTAAPSSAAIVSSAITGTVDRGPLVRIAQPARGEWINGTRVTVAGTVTDRGGGVDRIAVAGTSATLASDGSFRADVTVEPGLATVLVEAWDRGGQRTTEHVSVMAGSYAPETQLVSGATTVRISDGALNAIQPELTKGLEAQRDTIRSRILTTAVDKDVKITNANFGALRGTVNCQAGKLMLAAEVDALVVSIEAKGRFLFFFSTTRRGDVKANKVRVAAEVSIAVQSGQPIVSIGQVQGTAEGLVVPDFASDHRVEIQQKLQDGFAGAARQELTAAVQQALSTIYLGGTTRQTVIGRDLDLSWQLESLAIDDRGLTATLGANGMALQRPRGANAPGSFAAGGTLPVLTSTPGAREVGLAVHQDAVNRALHAAWRAGALDQVLDQAAMAGLSSGLPALLTTTALMDAVPELRGKLGPGLALSLTVEGGLPPVFTASDRGNAPLTLSIGDLRLRLEQVDASGGRTSVIELVCAARAPARVFERSGRVMVEPAGAPELFLDVVGEQLPGSAAVLEQLVSRVTLPAIQSALTGVDGVLLPAFRGYRAAGLRFPPTDRAITVVGTVATTP